MTFTAATVDGVSIRFDVAGSGPPLVLVHGLGDDRHIWSSLRPRFERSFTTFALDLRGHGESSRATDYDPFALGRDLEAVVVAARIERPLLIGHSLGAVAASAYGSRKPVSGILNIDQPLELSGLSARVSELGDQLHRLPAGQVVLDVLSKLGGLDRLSPKILRQLQETRSRLSREALLGIWRPLFASEEQLRDLVRAAFGKIDAPYLSLHGSAPSAGYAEWLSELIPTARVEVWDGEGHFPHLTDPERFSALFEQFASAVAAERGSP
jgi:pimeloyl-ACP methyl ester carboxylesterase